MRERIKNKQITKEIRGQLPVITPAPKGTLVNGVGAGDSMVAGFMAGWMEKQDYEYAFHMGVAAGSASAFSENLATKEEIQAVYKQISHWMLPFLLWLRESKEK